MAYSRPKKKKNRRAARGRMHSYTYPKDDGPITYWLNHPRKKTSSP